MIKKILFSFIILTFVAAIIAYFFGSKILSKGVKTGVETFGPKITQTPVRLDEVDLSILSGNGQLTGLYVSNPEGFSNENIFALSQIEVDIAARSIFSNEIVINKIYIQKPHISYEKTLRTSNLKELLKNIEGASSDETTDTQEPQPADTTEGEPAKDVLIKELVIEDPTVSLGIVGIGTTIQLPTIKLLDISGSGKQITASILEQIITKLFEEIKSGANQATNPAGSAGELLDSISDQYEEPVKQINDRINNLIGK